MDSLLALRGPPQPRDSDRTKHRSSRNSRHKEGHARRRQRSPSSSSPPIRRQHSRSPSPIRPRKHIRSTTNHRDGHKRHRRRGRSSHDARGVREADIEEEQDVGKRRHRRGRSISPIRSTRIAHPSLSGFPWNHDAASRHQLPRRTRKGLATTALVAGVFLFCLLSSRRSRRSRPETRTPIYPTFPVRPRAPMVAEAGSRMGFEEGEPLSDTDSEDEDDEPGTDTDSTERSHPMWLIRSQPRGGSSQPAIMPIIPSNFTFHESDESEDEDVDFQPARGEGSDGPSKECVVCSTEKDAEEFLQGITAECDHEVTTCRECLGHWIRTSLESRTWYDVRCAECPQNISYEDMMRIAPYDILDTIITQSFRTAISNMPDFHWCISSSCKSGQIHEVSLDGPVFRCHACGLRSCVAHNVPWHSGESCEEYTYRTRPKHQRKEDRASEKLVGRIAKICPGPNCGVKIQKTAGCDHMTCRQCTHEFCWICLASYTDIRRNGNGAHQPSCRYHSVDFEV